MQHNLAIPSLRNVDVRFLLRLDSFNGYTTKFSDNDDGFLSNVTILPVMYADYSNIRNEHRIPLSSFELIERHPKTSFVKDSQFKFFPGKDSETL